MPYVAHNRGLVRNALTALLTSKLVGAGKPVQSVTGYLPSDIKDGWPLVIVRSAGSRRRPGMRSHADFHDEFRFEVLTILSDADNSRGWTDQDVENKLDEIEAAIAEVISDNRSTADWFFLDFADEFSNVFVLTIGGRTYVAEMTNVVITMF